MDEYDKIIGSGGFGLVVKSNQTNTVVKLLYSAKSCEDAQIEYLTHLSIYDNIKQYLSKYQLCISAPIDYENTTIVKFSKEFSCYYRMSYINSFDKNGLYHIILKEENVHMMNKLIGRVYTEPVSSSNPSRGFFATASYLKNLLEREPSHTKKDLKTVEDLTFRLGLIFALLIFKCHYLPTDAEYVLARNHIGQICVCVLDFGMFSRINFDLKEVLPNKHMFILNKIVQNLQDIRDIDLYFPYEDDELYPTFIEGFTEGFHLAMKEEENDNLEIRKAKNYVFSQFINS